MKDLFDHNALAEISLKGIVLGLTSLFLNFFVIYFYLWNPFSVLFISTDQPLRYREPNAVSYVLSTAMIIILIVTAIIMIYKFFWKRRMFYGAPIATVIAILIFCGIYALAPKYPSLQAGGEKNGYWYETEIWESRYSGKKTYKRWKSREKYDVSKEANSYTFTLDSVSITKNSK